MDKGGKNGTEILATRIFLIRHGETDWNRIHRFQGRIDVPLNEEGKKQAQALALALRDEPLTAIYSSPLIRAIETANFIKAYHPSTPLFEEEGLIEMDLGEFDGMEAKVLAAKYGAFFETWRNNPALLQMPGGESLQEVQVRSVDTVEHISRLYPAGSTLLLCSHNFVNRTLLCYALEVPLNRFREVKQDLAALNMLLKKEDRLFAEIVNDVSHIGKYEGISAQK